MAYDELFDDNTAQKTQLDKVSGDAKASKWQPAIVATFAIMPLKSQHIRIDIMLTTLPADGLLPCNRNVAPHCTGGG